MLSVGGEMRAPLSSPVYINTNLATVPCSSNRNSNQPVKVNKKKIMEKEYPLFKLNCSVYLDELLP